MCIRDSLQHILNNEKKTIGLLKAIQNKQLLASDISTAFQQLLKQHTNKTIKEQAKKYFGAQNPKRNQLIIERLPKVTELKGNSSLEKRFLLYIAQPAINSGIQVIHTGQIFRR